MHAVAGFLRKFIDTVTLTKKTTESTNTKKKKKSSRSLDSGLGSHEDDVEDKTSNEDDDVFEGRPLRPLNNDIADRQRGEHLKIPAHRLKCLQDEGTECDVHISRSVQTCALNRPGRSDDDDDDDDDGLVVLVPTCKKVNILAFIASQDDPSRRESTGFSDDLRYVDDNDEDVLEYVDGVQPIFDTDPVTDDNDQFESSIPLSVIPTTLVDSGLDQEIPRSPTAEQAIFLTPPSSPTTNSPIFLTSTESPSFHGSNIDQSNLYPCTANHVLAQENRSGADVVSGFKPSPTPDSSDIHRHREGDAESSAPDSTELPSATCPSDEPKKLPMSQESSGKDRLITLVDTSCIESTVTPKNVNLKRSGDTGKTPSVQPPLRSCPTLVESLPDTFPEPKSSDIVSSLPCNVVETPGPNQPHVDTVHSLTQAKPDQEQGTPHEEKSWQNIDTCDSGTKSLEVNSSAGAQHLTEPNGCGYMQNILSDSFINDSVVRQTEEAAYCGHSVSCNTKSEVIKDSLLKTDVAVTDLSCDEVKQRPTNVALSSSTSNSSTESQRSLGCASLTSPSFYDSVCDEIDSTPAPASNKHQTTLEPHTDKHSKTVDSISNKSQTNFDSFCDERQTVVDSASDKKQTTPDPVNNQKQITLCPVSNEKQTTLDSESTKKQTTLDYVMEKKQTKDSVNVEKHQNRATWRTISQDYNLDSVAAASDDNHAKKSSVAPASDDNHAKTSSVAPSSDDNHAKKSSDASSSDDKHAKKSNHTKTSSVAPSSDDNHEKKSSDAPSSDGKHAKKSSVAPASDDNHAQKSSIAPSSDDNHAKKSSKSSVAPDDDDDYSRTFIASNYDENQSNLVSCNGDSTNFDIHSHANRKTTPSILDENQKSASAFNDKSQKVAPGIRGESQKVVPDIDDESQKVAPGIIDESQKIAPGIGDESQKVATDISDISQKIAPGISDKSQKIATDISDKSQTTLGSVIDENQTFIVTEATQTIDICDNSKNEPVVESLSTGTEGDKSFASISSSVSFESELTFESCENSLTESVERTEYPHAEHFFTLAVPNTLDYDSGEDPDSLTTPTFISECDETSASSKCGTKPKAVDGAFHHNQAPSMNKADNALVESGMTSTAKGAEDQCYTSSNNTVISSTTSTTSTTNSFYSVSVDSTLRQVAKDATTPDSSRPGVSQSNDLFQCGSSDDEDDEEITCLVESDLFTDAAAATEGDKDGGMDSDSDSSCSDCSCTSSSSSEDSSDEEFINIIRNSKFRILPVIYEVEEHHEENEEDEEDEEADEEIGEEEARFYDTLDIGTTERGSRADMFKEYLIVTNRRASSPGYADQVACQETYGFCSSEPGGLESSPSLDSSESITHSHTTSQTAMLETQQDTVQLSLPAATVCWPRTDRRQFSKLVSVLSMVGHPREHTTHLPVETLRAILKSRCASLGLCPGANLTPAAGRLLLISAYSSLISLLDQVGSSVYLSDNT
ncbi:LOW QUALITY PROTEIN: hypothetical protein ElyMa_005382600 [Elysia marginata]|uniref:Uncharacterized protein n=1 Tax=Elysia marginata TaxID=1093978 RepID=A0AAV4EEV1_9GAST|nr:LOW QUALITY PROTEIN: hypothetical protein ElyMa_005382600 [Elysia marginata]